MKHFQDLGHRVVFVVGDFTGDDRRSDRPLEDAAAADAARRSIANAETYKTQIFKILDPAKTEVRFNSEWLEPLGSDGWVKLAAKYNVAQMLERRDFKTALRGRPADRASTSSCIRWRRPTTRCFSRRTSSSAAPISSST